MLECLTSIFINIYYIDLYSNKLWFSPSIFSEEKFKKCHVSTYTWIIWSTGRMIKIKAVLKWMWHRLDAVGSAIRTSTGPQLPDQLYCEGGTLTFLTMFNCRYNTEKIEMLFTFRSRITLCWLINLDRKPSRAEISSIQVASIHGTHFSSQSVLFVELQGIPNCRF